MIANYPFWAKCYPSSPTPLVRRKDRCEEGAEIVMGEAHRRGRASTKRIAKFVPPCVSLGIKTTQELDDAVITAGHVVNPVSKAAEQLGTRLRSLEAMTRTVRFDVSVGDDVGSEPVAVLCDVSQRPEEQGQTSGGNIHFPSII